MRLNTAIVAGGLGFAVSALAACGSSGGLLSASQAGDLSNQLAQISHAISTGHCQQAATALSTFQNTVAGLSSVNRTLINNLNQGVSTISQLTAKDCSNVSTATTTQTTTIKKTKTTPTTPTTSTATTPTSTSTTPTTPPTTTSTPTSTSTTGGAGIGNGQGSGTGTSGGAGAGN